jgi:hypothetical protein
MKKKLNIFPVTFTSYLVLVLCAGLWMPTRATSQTPAFTAQDQVAQASQAAGGKVEVTFSVRIYDNGASDVNYGTLSVANPAAIQKFGSFENVSASLGGNTLVSGQLTLPQNIYKSWQNGSRPLLNLDYTDINGNPIHQVFQATAVPAGKSL